MANDKNLALVFDSLSNYQLDKKAIVCGSNQIDIAYDRPIDIIFTGSRGAEKLSAELQSSFSSEQSSRTLQQIAFDLGLITSNKVVFESKFSQKQGYKCIAGVIKITNN